MATAWPQALERAERLVRVAAPELWDVPIYLVPQTETPFAESKMHGFTSPSCDLLLREGLGNRYRGRGLGIVLNTAAFERERGDQDLQADFAAAVAVHEAGHALAEGWATADREETDATYQEHIHRVIPQAAAKMATLEEYVPAVAKKERLHHGPDWLRVVLHMRRRVLAVAGVYLFAMSIVGPRPMTPPCFFEDALGDEPERLARLPLAEVLKLDPPAEFTRLWDADTRSLEAEWAAEAQQQAITPAPELKPNE